MRGLPKGVSLCLNLFLCILLCTSLGFAAITVVEKDNCANEFRMFDTFRANNSHTSAVYDDLNLQGYLQDFTGYDYTFCYAPNQTGGARETLVYNHTDTLRDCWAENIILRATTDVNGHVAIPHNGLVNQDEYDVANNLCYGYLQCSATADPYSQVVAKLSDEDNAHISPATNPGTDFPVALNCWEPICDEDTFAEKIGFPNLYTFDDDKGHFETANLNNTPGRSFGALPVGIVELSFEAMKVTLGTIKTTSLSPIRIQNWEGYDAFEFFVYFPNDVNMETVFLTLNGSLSYNVSEYAVKTVKSGQWNKIRIPKPSSGFGTVDTITFSITNSNKPVTFYVDSMTFITNSETNNQYDSSYCGKNEDSTEYFWVDDADDSVIACDNVEGLTDIAGGCCGDDLGEFFGDNATGCYDSIPIANNTAFDVLADPIDGPRQICIGADCPGALVDVDGNISVQDIHYGFANGTFYGCGSPLILSDNITTVGGTPTNTPLLFDIKYAGGVNDTGDACVVVGDYVCSPKGYFTNRTDDVEGTPVYNTQGAFTHNEPIDSAGNRTVLTQDFVSGGDKMCCPTGYCSHDGQCYADMTGNTNQTGIELSDGTFNRCVDGAWNLNATELSNPDGSESGYCPTAGDCFISATAVDIGGTFSKCIGTNEQYFDNYCYESHWTSRTAVLAKAIVKFADNPKYTLFCDSFEKTLNYLGESDSGRSVKSLLKGSAPNGAQLCSSTDNRDCVNNFCVVNAGNDVVFGTSLNWNISDTTVGLGAVFDLNCTGAVESGKDYIQCTDASDTELNWFYYPESDIIIFEKADGWLESMGSVLSDLVDGLLALLPFTDKAAVGLPATFDEVKLFNRVYISTGSSVEIQGFTENIDNGTGNVDALYINYESDTPLVVCDLVESIKKSEDPQGVIDCVRSTDNKNHTITSTSDIFAERWVDLTAKLRQS